MKQSLLITFTSPDRPGIIEALTHVMVAHGGNWQESRLARLCGDFAGIARVTVDTQRALALTQDLEGLQIDGLHVTVKGTASPQPTAAPNIQARLTCAGADHEGIVSCIASFLAKQRINVEEMETGVEPAPVTGTPVFQMHCQLSIPAQVDYNSLHAQLQELAGKLAVDISLETV